MPKGAKAKAKKVFQAMSVSEKPASGYMTVAELRKCLSLASPNDVVAVADWSRTTPGPIEPAIYVSTIYSIEIDVIRTFASGKRRRISKNVPCVTIVS